MAGAPNKATMPPRNNMPVFGTYTGNQASIFLEKANPGLRRSTPDSEALASSDEEPENSRLKSAANARNSIKPVRRTFSLADHSSPGRKPSMTASGTYNPSTSNPATPSADQNPWPSMSPSAGAWGSASAYPFTSSIWSQDSRKDPPSRLQEMHASESQDGIPFSIPLQPTPKTYRSQSYSVGQLEPGTSSAGAPAAPATMDPPRSRAGGPISTLQRRTSRQGILSSGTVANLGGLREVDDDEDPLDSTQTKVDQAREIERLEMENAQLRAAQSRERTLSSTSAMHMAPGFRNTRIRSAVPEEPDIAIDDNEELGGQYPQRNLTRRFSEQVAQYPDRQPLAPGDSRNARWQTTLGFGRLADIPQSRRHSFADVPTRHGSFSSHDPEDPDAFDAEQRGYGKIDERKSARPLPVHKPMAPACTMTRFRNVPVLAHPQARVMVTAPHTNPTTLPMSGSSAQIPLTPLESSSFREGQQGSLYFHPLAIYFQVDENRRREAEASVQKGIAYANPYGIPSNMSGPRPPGQSFYIVNFKCCRSDIFYIQEGTGLQVQVGDLVIVDADRGTDLGAVQHCHVTLEEARRYKEYYAEEHYKLLMMFSQQTKNGGMNAVNPNGPSGRPSAVGGMGPQGHGHRDPHGDPKAKMIKRLAQVHEIQALKEKEGNEAKAKRVCSQKVVEHSLNMEILDAEFQMDSKKLTFYYFADEYINFNSLVTDLFKIYKTRIWMSAINPASFQTPTSSLGLTPAFGNPAFGAPPPPPQSETPRRNTYNMGNGMGYQFEDARAVSRGGIPPPFYPQYQSSPGINQRMGTGLGSYAPGIQPPMDPFSAYPNPNFGMFGQGQSYSRQDIRGHGQSPNTHPNLVSDFQNMSMS